MRCGFQTFMRPVSGGPRQRQSLGVSIVGPSNRVTWVRGKPSITGPP
jgi:hypothetical protein